MIDPVIENGMNLIAGNVISYEKQRSKDYKK